MSVELRLNTMMREVGGLHLRTAMTSSVGDQVNQVLGWGQGSHGVVGHDRKDESGHRQNRSLVHGVLTRTMLKTSLAASCSLRHCERFVGLLGVPGQLVPTIRK